MVVGGGRDQPAPAGQAGRPAQGPAAQATFNPGITWAGWQVPVPVQIAIVVGTCLVLLGLAVARFARTE